MLTIMATRNILAIMAISIAIGYSLNAKTPEEYEMSKPVIRII